MMLAHDTLGAAAGAAVLCDAGSIPRELRGLSSLWYLHLEYNSLSGKSWVPHFRVQLRRHLLLYLAVGSATLLLRVAYRDRMTTGKAVGTPPNSIHDGNHRIFGYSGS